MEDSFKEKIRLAKSFNQNTVIRNGKLGRILGGGGNLPQKQLSEYLSEVSYHSTII